MALDKSSSQSASTLATTIATGLVGVFAALAPHVADAHGGGGGAHGGGGGAHGGASMGHAPAGGGRAMGGAHWNGGGNFRGNSGFRHGFGFRGPRVFIGGGVPYYYDYGPSYYDAQPVYVVPRTYIAESAPQQRQAPPAPPQKTICADGPYAYVCIDPDGTKHEYVKPKLTNTAVPQAPAKAATLPPAPPKTNAPAVCTKAVVQVHTFNSTSSLDKQFPKSIPDNCSAIITRINAYDDQLPTDIQREKGVVTINYNGSKVDTTSDTFIAGSVRELYNIAALTPSSTWDKTFPSVDGKRKPMTHTIIVHASTSAATIEVTPKRGDDAVIITDKPAAPTSAITQSAAATGTAPASTPTPGISATAHPTATPQHIAASSAATPSKGHWYTSWWTWGAVAAIGATALIARAINNSRYPAVPGGPEGGPEGGPQGGGAPRSEASSESASARREGGTPETGPEPQGASALLRTFNDAETRGIFTAFRENRGDPANEVKFKLNESGDAILVSTKDSNAEVRHDSIKATLKTDAVTFSDETIKGMLESHYNLHGGASKEGKHRIEVNCSDEVFARVVHFANTAKGQPFEIVRKPSAPLSAAAAETPVRPGAANDARFSRPGVAPLWQPKVA